MANTIKFGNGQWATKKDSILAFNDENANFKPLPFTATRASTATVVNKAGLLETVGTGIPRVDYLSNTSGAYLLEPSSTNLITQSEAFGNSYWTKSGAAIQGDASTAGSEQVVNGDFATDSDWTKGSAWTISGGVANYDYSATSEFASIGSNLIVGKLYQLKFNLVGTSARIYLTSALGWKTLTTGSYNYAFYATDSELMFMGANDGGRSAFTLDNVSVKEVQGFSAPSADTPLGAFKLVENSGTGQHRMSVSISSPSAIHTISAFFKPIGTNRKAYLDMGSVTGYFDFTTKVFTSATGVGSYEEVSDGWYKLSLTSNSAVTISAIFIGLAISNETYTGDGTSGVYIFGAQIEAKSYPTSYIPTAGSAITRMRDLCDTQNLSQVIGQTEGAIFYDAILVHKSINTSEDLFELSIDNGTNQNIFFINNYNNTLTIGMKNGGSTQFINNSFNPIEGARYKLAFAYKQNDFALYINGNQIATDTSGTVPAMNQITFGNYYNNQTNLQNSVKVNDFKLYNTRLSNTELVKLTTI